MSKEKPVKKEQPLILPVELHSDIKEYAKSRGMTMRGYIMYLHDKEKKNG